MRNINKKLIGATLLIISLFMFLPLVPANAETAAEKLQKEGFIFLQVKIPSPICITGSNENVKCCDDSLIQQYIQEKNKSLAAKQQISCPAGSIAAVKNAPAFIVSFFQFGIIFLAILVTGVLVVAGAMYVASGGNRNRASKAMGYMQNAAISLVVLIFSTVILNQIGPRFVSLGVSNVTSIQAKFLCAEVKDEKICAEKGCLWEKETSKCKDLSSLSCGDLNTQPQCAKFPGKCEWDAGLNTCITTRPSGTTCSLADDFYTCYTSIGCVWDYGACKAIDPTNQTAITQCDALTKEDSCRQNSLCVWATPACVLEKVALNRNCSEYTVSPVDNCPNVACYKTPGRTCEPIKKIGETCDTTVRMCGTLAFCNPDTKKCQVKLRGDEDCEGLPDSACWNNDCTDRIGTDTCTNLPQI